MVMMWGVLEVVLVIVVCLGVGRVVVDEVEVFFFGLMILLMRLMMVCVLGV